jgi:hypothetical protein
LQFSSIPLEKISRAPGKIAAFASLQSTSEPKPSPSPSMQV